MAFDLKLLPPDTPKSAVFLAYLDADKHMWIPVGGQVDEQRNVVTIQTDHLSIWAPWTWDWNAWIAALKGTLSLDLSDFLKGVATLTESCTESAQTAIANNAGGNNVIQGCITEDDPLHPQLRVVNLKSFYIGISSIPSGPPNPEPGILKPGDPVRFTIDSTATPPLTVRAGFDDLSMRWFAVSLVMRLLSAAAPLGDLKNPDRNKAALAFIAVRITDIWDAKEIIDAFVAGDRSAAAIKLAQKIGEIKFGDRVVKLLAQYGADHNLPMLTKLSSKGVNKFVLAVASVDNLISSTDFIANYFFNHESKVVFQWVRPRPATITVAKPQYYPEETVRVCYTIPTPGHVTITDYSSDGGQAQLLSGDVPGTGDCVEAIAQGPASTERVVLDYTSGGRKASVETKYEVLDRPARQGFQLIGPNSTRYSQGQEIVIGPAAYVRGPSFTTGEPSCSYYVCSTTIGIAGPPIPATDVHVQVTPNPGYDVTYSNGLGAIKPRTSWGIANRQQDASGCYYRFTVTINDAPFYLKFYGSCGY